MQTLFSIRRNTRRIFGRNEEDSYFFHNILDISQSHNRIVRVSKGSNKKSFAFKVFQFCDSKLQQRLILKEEVSISKNEIESVLDSLGDFLKAFDQANKVSQIPLPKPKFEIGFTKAKDELFSHCYKDIVEHLSRQIRISFRFEKNKTCVFCIKKFEHYGDHFILTEVVNLGFRGIKHLYKNRFFLLASATVFRAITMCSTDCAYDNSAIIIIGDVYCPNAKRLGKPCLHKKTFQSPGRIDYQCPQSRVRDLPFEEQINSFFLSLGQGVDIFGERPKSVQEVIGDVYCPGKYCLNTEKCKSIGGYVQTPRSIYGCDNCGAWLFVHKVPFKLQEHIKTTKKDKTRLSLLKKMLPDK